jgi:hypothetical protein
MLAYQRVMQVPFRCHFSPYICTNSAGFGHGLNPTLRVEKLAAALFLSQPRSFELRANAPSGNLHHPYHNPTFSWFSGDNAQ